MNLKKQEIQKSKNLSHADPVAQGNMNSKLQKKSDAHQSHIEELQLHHKTTTTAIKNFTIMIIIKITGTFIQSFLSFFACVVYVIGTYYPDSEVKTTSTGQTFQWLEIAIAGLFSIDYLIGMLKEG